MSVYSYPLRRTLWSGSFKSQYYFPYLSRIEILFPDFPIQGEEYYTEALLRTYQGKLSVPEIKYTEFHVISPRTSNPLSSSLLILISGEKHPGIHLYVNFITDNCISGNYEVTTIDNSGLVDKGSFELIRTDRNCFSIQNESSCSVS